MMYCQSQSYIYLIYDSYINNDIITISRKGLIKNNLNISNESTYSRCYLGHVRYKTSGNFESNTHQPIYGENKFGAFSFVFNGNSPLGDVR